MTEKGGREGKRRTGHHPVRLIGERHITKVGFDHLETSLIEFSSEPLSQSPGPYRITLDGDNPTGSGQKRFGQRTFAGSHLDHQVVGLDLGSGDQPIDLSGIGEEILPESASPDVALGPPPLAGHGPSHSQTYSQGSPRAGTAPPNFCGTDVTFLCTPMAGRPCPGRPPGRTFDP